MTLKTCFKYLADKIAYKFFLVRHILYQKGHMSSCDRSPLSVSSFDALYCKIQTCKHSTKGLKQNKSYFVWYIYDGVVINKYKGLSMKTLQGNFVMTGIHVQVLACVMVTLNDGLGGWELETLWFVHPCHAVLWALTEKRIKSCH